MKSNLNKIFESMLDDFKMSNGFSIEDALDEIMPQIKFEERVTKAKMARQIIRGALTTLLNSKDIYSYEKGKFVEAMPLKEALSYGKLRSGKELPNPIDRDNHYGQEKEACQALLPDAVEQAKKYLAGFYEKYQEKAQPQINDEISKLADLENKHRDYQISLFQNRSERKLNENIRKVDELFTSFYNWVNETMTIENSPYIRVIAVLTARGGKQRG